MWRYAPAGNWPACPATDPLLFQAQPDPPGFFYGRAEALPPGSASPLNNSRSASISSHLPQNRSASLQRGADDLKPGGNEALPLSGQDRSASLEMTAGRGTKRSPLAKTEALRPKDIPARATPPPANEALRPPKAFSGAALHYGPGMGLLTPRPEALPLYLAARSASLPISPSTGQRRPGPGVELPSRSAPPELRPSPFGPGLKRFALNKVFPARSAPSK